MKKILLIDADSKIPNLALMKLSTYYKTKGNVTLKQLGISFYKPKRVEVEAYGYDRVIASFVFKGTNNVCKIKHDSLLMIGGSGYSLTRKLPDFIERLSPDYSIYPDNEISYGFITRGCIRHCKFCIVPEKEGWIHRVNSISDIVQHKKTEFLDANILAYEHHKDIFEELIDKKVRCRFGQGLDIRLVNYENAELISRLNYWGNLTFAFDNIRHKIRINQKLKILNHYIKQDWKIRFFIYCHPSMSIKNDVLFRIMWCRRNKVLPYLMRDKSCYSDPNHRLYVDLAAWCNQPSFFKKMSFSEFLEKRYSKNKERVHQEKKLTLV